MIACSIRRIAALSSAPFAAIAALPLLVQGAPLGAQPVSKSAPVSAAAPAAAERPDPAKLAQRIDAAIAKALFQTAKVELDSPDAKDVATAKQPAPPCDDATFLRRAWLDVVGDVPAPEHLIAFTLDKSYDKRAQLVRDLLADPQYGVNWARYWRDVVFYRRVEDRALLAENAMEADLSQRLNDNVPWSRIAAEFITAKGDVRENGATAIIMAQEGRTEETAAEMARIFLGIQIQCAQCHDHRTDQWKREQFHELAAFFPRIGVRPVISPTRRSFQVIVNDRPFARPKMGNNAERMPTPEHFMPDMQDPAAQGTRMQPKFFLTGATLPLGSTDQQRRETIARWFVENEWFATALVNRLWGELVGEGFYEPIDDIGPERTPTAADAVQLLSQGFRDSGYDLKWLMETICTTQTYQRQARPRRETDGVPFAANVPQPLRADQLFNAALSALDANEEPEGPLRRPGKNGNGGGPRSTFNVIFGYDPSEPRDEISGSIPQALSLMNSPRIARSLKANPNTMLGRLAAEIKDNRDLTAELYLRTLSRPPTHTELTRSDNYFAATKNRNQAVEDLAWALINSAEFRHRP